MTTKSSALRLFLLVFIGVIVFPGCHKKVASTHAPTPAAPVAPPAPTVTLQASPADITKGGSAKLTWSPTNATQLSLSPGLGSVSQQRSQQVAPTESTTYTITATSNGGRAEASARITVSMPPAAVVPSPDLNALFQGPINDAFFGYDKSDIRPDARAALEKDAEFLNLHHDIRFAIEGAL